MRQTTKRLHSKQGADLIALRRNITELVARNAVTMVQHAIDSVNDDGQFQAIRYLFEMIGLYPPVANEGEASEDSLAEILLRKLQIADEHVDNRRLQDKQKSQ